VGYHPDIDLLKPCFEAFFEFQEELETPRSTRPIVSHEWLFGLVTYLPGGFAIILDEHFVTGIRFLVLETIAPARRGCGQLDTVCAWRGGGERRLITQVFHRQYIAIREPLASVASGSGE